MKTLRSVLRLFTTGLSLAATAPSPASPLRVAAASRTSAQADRPPLFSLGDTAWLRAQKLNCEKTKTCFENLRTQGFTLVPCCVVPCSVVPCCVVPCCVVPCLHDKGFNGRPALVDETITTLNAAPGRSPSDPAQPNYWDHVASIVDTAAANGIIVAIAPVSSHTVRRTPFTAALVAPYIDQVAPRSQSCANVIWLKGGSGRGHENADLWQVIGETLKYRAPPRLVSAHPFRRTVSTEWFKDTPWLDFPRFTCFQRRYHQDTDGRKFSEDNWRHVLASRAPAPSRPVLDAEPASETTPQGLHKPEEPCRTGHDSRQYADWSVFSGAPGHTFGANSVRQVEIPLEKKPASGAQGFILERLDSEGAGQMCHLKNLPLSRPLLGRVNDRAHAAGDEGEKYDRVLITRGAGGVLASTDTGARSRSSCARAASGRSRADGSIRAPAKRRRPVPTPAPTRSPSPRRARPPQPTTGSSSSTRLRKTSRYPAHSDL